LFRSRLLRTADKGAVAALMPTGKSTTGGQYILVTALFETIFSEDVRLLGPAILQAKQTLLANGSSEYEELSETFTEFEDPTAQIGVTYYYVVSSVDEDTDESVQSASVSALIGDSSQSDVLLALVPCFIGTAAEGLPRESRGAAAFLAVGLMIGAIWSVRRHKAKSNPQITQITRIRNCRCKNNRTDD
jgi:hypothetical protein